MLSGAVKAQVALDAEIFSAPPPSAGGIGLIEMLNILRPYDLARLGDRSAPEVQLITEAMRRAAYAEEALSQFREA